MYGHVFVDWTGEILIPKMPVLIRHHKKPTAKGCDGRFMLFPCQTALTMQRRLHLRGQQMVILPMKIS